jgi:hypothetical protein
MTFNYYPVSLNKANPREQTHIPGMSKSIEIGAKPLFYCVECWHRYILLVQKNRYLSTSVAMRLSPSVNLAVSGRL